jgi:hypothetical protein
LAINCGGGVIFVTHVPRLPSYTEVCKYRFSLVPGHDCFQLNPSQLPRVLRTSPIIPCLHFPISFQRSAGHVKFSQTELLYNDLTHLRHSQLVDIFENSTLRFLGIVSHLVRFTTPEFSKQSSPRIMIKDSSQYSPVDTLKTITRRNNSVTQKGFVQTRNLVPSRVFFACGLC